MALHRLWWIAYGNSANLGAYVRYPLAELMAILALESRRARCVIVGEDLGIVPDEMRVALGEYGVYSYGVMYFNHNGARYLLPEEYPEHALAVVSTHDLAPLAGYWEKNDLNTMQRLGVFTSDAQYQNLLAQRESRKGQIIAALHQTELRGDESQSPLCHPAGKPLGRHRLLQHPRHRQYLSQLALPPAGRHRCHGQKPPTARHAAANRRHSCPTTRAAPYHGRYHRYHYYYRRNRSDIR